MIGFILGYSAAKSSSRSRARRESTSPGYEEWSFLVIMGSLLIGVVWPIHVGIKLTQWGLHIGWSIFIGGLLGVIGLLTGVGYFIIGILYAGIWLALFIENGKAAEDAGDNDHLSWLS